MGPLQGTKVVELAGIGPAPYACMLLADAGAQVIRVDRATRRPQAYDGDPSSNFLARSRRSVAVDLKHPDGVALVLDLVASADVLVEGWRPGVAERLGLGPDICWLRNPRLVYGRMTGWGQDGPMAARAGHDIDYIALSGALWSVGRAGERPVPPLNLVGDFGGGGMLLAFGVCAALLEAARSGRGQVVDAAMVEGSASLMTMVYGMMRSGAWSQERGTNLLDTGAPFYDVYQTADDQFMAVGAIEPQFYAALLAGLGLDGADLPSQMDHDQWPALRQRFIEVFRTRSRDEWAAVFDGTDACVAPVLTPLEAQVHPHNVARSTFVDVDGVLQPAAVPRFSRTPAAVQHPPSNPGADRGALADWGIAARRIEALHRAGVVD